MPVHSHYKGPFRIKMTSRDKNGGYSVGTVQLGSVVYYLLVGRNRLDKLSAQLACVYLYNALREKGSGIARLRVYHDTDDEQRFVGLSQRVYKSWSHRRTP